MKRTIIITALAAMFALGANAQGSFKTIEGNGFKVHVYNSGDAMGDASYIIETKKGLVTMEEPLFKVGAEEFGTYVKKLGKPVTDRITNYHEGATGNHPVYLAEGMNKEMHEGAYDAMMKGFQQSFGDKMVARPTGKVKEVKFDTTIKLNSVSYTFYRGPKNDFPTANIRIGKKFLLMHWAPARQHMNVLQLSNREAVAQALTGLKEAKAVGVAYVLGGHGGVATKDALNFRIAYLEKMQQLLNENKNAGSFANALKAAYPGLAGEDAVKDLAQALYK